MPDSKPAINMHEQLLSLYHQPYITHWSPAEIKLRPRQRIPCRVNDAHTDTELNLRALIRRADIHTVRKWHDVVLTYFVLVHHNQTPNHLM